MAATEVVVFRDLTEKPEPDRRTRPESFELRLIFDNVELFEVAEPLELRLALLSLLFDV